jgi:phosphoribosylamine--glycine ligase
VVIEEFLSGQEISLMAFVDGKTIRPMVIAQDHKPVYDGDQGPNTGGMGAYSPVPQIPNSVVEQSVEMILVPMVNAFNQEGIEFKGVLYAGLMITADGPKVIEFNARLGDPETQVVLPRLKTELIDILLAVTEGYLASIDIEWIPEAAVCVVMAAGGYPGAYEIGHEIKGLLQESDNIIIFHAGTRKVDGRVVTSGGRVLGVTALRADIADARAQAYHLVKQISFKDVHYRADIAAKALK